MIIWKNLGLRKFISFYIQLFKFSPSVNVEVKQILFYLNLKNGKRVYSNVIKLRKTEKQEGSNHLLFYFILSKKNTLLIQLFYQ